ncbi:hypothetical protein ABZ865_09945 [Streptomyces sp. NPDC047085]|uniref:hypothetical protein n=1 Tax=Streptomyces sp. NPDC047085 TaxID=3155140 RepID=UPI0033DDCF8B
MTISPLREAARVIALDDTQRVLLLRYHEGGGYWATPGCSLEVKEDHAAAALALSLDSTANRLLLTGQVTRASRMGRRPSGPAPQPARTAGDATPR